MAISLQDKPASYKPTICYCQTHCILSYYLLKFYLKKSRNNKDMFKLTLIRSQKWISKARIIDINVIIEYLVLLLPYQWYEVYIIKNKKDLIFNCLRLDITFSKSHYELPTFRQK